MTLSATGGGAVMVTTGHNACAASCSTAGAETLRLAHERVQSIPTTTTDDKALASISISATSP
jgi:hypothetical protein